MESIPSTGGPPVFLVPPGSVPSAGRDDQRVTLTGPEGHHAAAVRRLRAGERADVSDGAGTMAEGIVAEVGKDSVAIDLVTVHVTQAPRPRLTVAQALPKGDRGELAVELMTEVGVDAVIPWAAARSITRWQAERGAKALGRWRATAREAAKQSRRGWLPDISEMVTTASLAKHAAQAFTIVLEADSDAKLHELALPADGEILLVVGPEGGISPQERAALRDAGAVEARLGPTVLRTSTAGAAAAAVLLSRAGRW
jgi:16S rRNA (uracil1498-N3)-methyltransferase